MATGKLTPHSGYCQWIPGCVFLWALIKEWGQAGSGVDLHLLHNTSELSHVLHFRYVKMTMKAVLKALNFSINKMVQRQIQKWVFVSLCLHLW